MREAGLYLRKLNKTGDLRIAVLDDRMTFYATAKSGFVKLYGCL